MEIDFDKYRTFAQKHGIVELPAYYVVEKGRAVFKTHDIKALSTYIKKENHGQTLH
jgi:hypothetical protein